MAAFSVPENATMILSMGLIRAYYRLAIVVVLALVAIAMVIPMTMRLAVEPFMFASIDKVPQTEVALVLGASVRRGVPSPVLALRADTAIALYKAGKVSKILVTGDNGALSHDEVTPVRKYLLDAGIPTQDIFLDHAGFDTYSSMYRARDIFGVSSILISTQSFHLPRAVFIARMLGIEASGVNADIGHMLFRNYVREALANEKAVLNLIFHRKPKYLGESIPIEDDDRSYP